jgi:hypothetical protein
MPLYQVAQGHDNSGALANITPQPRCSGVRYARRTYSADGQVYEDGALLSAWEFTAISESEYAALLIAFGLTAAASAAITARTVISNDRTFGIVNATIIRPAEARFREGVLRDIAFDLVDIEEL